MESCSQWLTWRCLLACACLVACSSPAFANALVDEDDVSDLTARAVKTPLTATSKSARHDATGKPPGQAAPVNAGVSTSAIQLAQELANSSVLLRLTIGTAQYGTDLPEAYFDPAARAWLGSQSVAPVIQNPSTWISWTLTDSGTGTDTQLYSHQLLNPSRDELSGVGTRFAIDFSFAGLMTDAAGWVRSIDQGEFFLSLLEARNLVILRPDIWGLVTHPLWLDQTPRYGR